MIPIIHAPSLLKIPFLSHGFFTRQGGVSEGLFATLNVASNKGDNPLHVQENNKRIAKALGCKPEHVITISQTHSTNAVIVESLPIPLQEGDALITQRPGIAVGVLTADCGPVLMVDPYARIIGAVHAGWRGAVAGVIEKALEKMERLGGNVTRVVAAVGPCIWQDSYEVGPEFLSSFPLQEKEHFFKPSIRQDHWLFDLPGYIAYRLRKAGVEIIDPSPYDTFSNPDLFFSYRRRTLQGEETFGNSLSAIMIKTTADDKS